METKLIKIEAKRKDTAGSLYLYGDIGGFEGITADNFQAALADLGDVTSLTLYINSPGGSVFDAKAIIAQLDRKKAAGCKVVAVVDGLAASAASFIAMAADEVQMHQTAKMMIHLPHAIAAGNAEDFRKMADLLESEADALVQLYADKTGLSAKKIIEMMTNETWMTASEAVDLGFADSVVGGTADVTASTSKFEAVVAKTKALTNPRQIALANAKRLADKLNKR